MSASNKTFEATDVRYSVDSLDPEFNSRSRQRALGAYYTPDALSAVVTRWAIEKLDDRILEPGFGGCGFLMAAKQRLEALGQKYPQDFIHGCDIDDAAFGHLKDIFGAKPSNLHFPKIDFLEAQPGKTWSGRKFRVALGNPPYVAYQAISQRDEYQLLMKRSGWTGLSARASLWAYFVLHAISFLEKGGRIAWVLPGSLLRANYSKYVKEIIATRFSRAALFHVHERLFSSAGAEEETVVLCADGFSEAGDSSHVLHEYFVENVNDLAPAIASWDNGLTAKTIQSKLQLQILLDNFPGRKKIELRELLMARIGLVTGDNNFFLFSKQRAAQNSIDLNHLQPILAKGAMAPGLTFGTADINDASAENFSCYLLSSPTLPAKNANINYYLENYPKERIENVSTYKKRALWHKPEDGKIPDAFWPVMRDVGPKLILNPQGWHCTNTLHRIFFAKNITKLQQMLIAVCLQSTYAQLHAELCGRSYGSGVLKHEPRDVENIRIPWPQAPAPHPVKESFKAIDKALRDGRLSDATNFADVYVATYINEEYTSEYIKLLQSALIVLRRVRLPQHRIRKQ